jgi:U3 small nucleolar RNA-associated protein 14
VIGEGVRLNSINQIASNLRDTHATSKLERQIQEELSRQGLRSEKDVKQMELESLSASVKPEQLEQRYGQIAQMKHLLFRQEMKNRRVSKIKSKLYHKLKKREKDREEKKLIDYLEQIDPEAAQAYRLKEEHKKVEERLKLRHSSNNKFSKTLKRFGGMENESLKEAFNDMMKEKNALKSRVSSVQSANKRALDSEEDDDDGGSEGSDIEDEITLKQ